MTKKLAPKQSLDERVQRATAAFLVAVSRDPHEHPDVRQDARQRLKRPAVESFGPYLATLDATKLRALQAVLGGQPIPCACTRTAPTAPDPAVVDPAPARDPDPEQDQDDQAEQARAKDPG